MSAPLVTTHMYWFAHVVVTLLWCQKKNGSNFFYWSFILIWFAQGCCYSALARSLSLRPANWQATTNSKQCFTPLLHNNACSRYNNTDTPSGNLTRRIHVGVSLSFHCTFIPPHPFRLCHLSGQKLSNLVFVSGLQKTENYIESLDGVERSAATSTMRDW